MKARFDGIVNRIGQPNKRESESLLLEHLECLESGWDTEGILFFLKALQKMFVLNPLL